MVAGVEDIGEHIRAVDADQRRVVCFRRAGCECQVVALVEPAAENVDREFAMGVVSGCSAIFSTSLS